jgi:PadR family transcriptional regulator PadR
VAAERRDPGEMLPLSPLDYHVLLVLAGGDLYGYAIKKAVDRESGGVVSPEIGSLYRVLARLLDSGLVTEAAAPHGGREAHRGRDRKYYGLTSYGRQALRAETARLRGALALADERDLVPEPPGT